MLVKAKVCWQVQRAKCELLRVVCTISLHGVYAIRWLTRGYGVLSITCTWAVNWYTLATTCTWVVMITGLHLRSGVHERSCFAQRAGYRALWGPRPHCVLKERVSLYITVDLQRAIFSLVSWNRDREWVNSCMILYWSISMTYNLWRFSSHTAHHNLLMFSSHPSDLRPIEVQLTYCALITYWCSAHTSRPITYWGSAHICRLNMHNGRTCSQNNCLYPQLESKSAIIIACRCTTELVHPSFECPCSDFVLLSAMEENKQGVCMCIVRELNSMRGSRRSSSWWLTPSSWKRSATLQST